MTGEKKSMLVISPWEPPACGIASHTYNLVAHWTKTYDVHVLTSGETTGEENADGVHVWRNLGEEYEKSIAEINPVWIYMAFPISPYVRGRHIHHIHLVLEYALHRAQGPLRRRSLRAWFCCDLVARRLLCRYTDGVNAHNEPTRYRLEGFFGTSDTDMAPQGAPQLPAVNRDTSLARSMSQSGLALAVVDRVNVYKGVDDNLRGWWGGPEDLATLLVDLAGEGMQGRKSRLKASRRRAAGRTGTRTGRDTRKVYERMLKTKKSAGRMVVTRSP